MSLPRDRVEPGAATPNQIARGERWHERRQRRGIYLAPGLDRDRWAAHDADAEEARVEQQQITRGGNR